ncbi:MAG: glycoside hydrolase family 36 protein [Ignavibacterium sp.]|uniref:glycoside hydrolase family 36 protein n=1 Tax=Ignavibacterium sp. TaxID=2651167 RepID=UPI00404ACA8A
MKRIFIELSFILIYFISPILFAQQNIKAQLSSSIFNIEYDSLMFSKIKANFKDAAALMNRYYPSEQLILKSDTIKNFSFVSKKELYTDKSNELILEGVYSENHLNIKKVLNVSYQKKFPGILITKVKYFNLSQDTLTVVGWINNNYNILSTNDTAAAFWSYQGATYEDRRDWVKPIKDGFYQENYMGMNASDYGGGTPVSDIWRPDIGFGVGLLELTPKLVSIPVKFLSFQDGANIHLAYKFLEEKKLGFGDSIETYETFISIHKGDYFKTLVDFRKILQERGLVFHDFPNDAYEPEWCAWGYERNFTIDEILGTLPKVSEVGYDWVTLDDGWQTAEGDWYLNPEKFPNGDADMKAFVDEIHNRGLKAMLWWAPLAVDPGTDLIKEHPEYLLLNKDSSLQKISWWDSYYLCPAYQPVIDYHVNLVKKFIGEWGFDGLKIDGQHLNAVPPCYNPIHHHSNPEESVEKLPLFYKAIYDAAKEINPNVVIQFCPCGTSYSFFNLPYVNQTVASDPTSSWQIRLKGKTLKALMGSNSPYFGDHVELSDGGTDFASTVGVGGIVGTKFTYPTDRLKHKNYLLTKDKESIWKKWINIYNNNLLSKADYKGELYDIGYDKPETHAIQKGDTLYYAFFAKKWSGPIELRGLDKNKSYKIIDYVNENQLAVVKGQNPKPYFDFEKYLLIKAIPINNKSLLKK